MVRVTGVGNVGVPIVTQSPVLQLPVWQAHDTIVTDTFSTVDALVRITSLPSWLN